MEQGILFHGYSPLNISRVKPLRKFLLFFCFWLNPPTVYIRSSWNFINSYTMMWSSTYYFKVTVHQIFADLCPFESFCKLFAVCCLEVIVCKFYHIIDILFANNWSFGHMGKLLIFFFFFFNIFFYLTCKERLSLLNLYKYIILFDFFFNTLLIWLPWRTKIKSVLNKLKVYKKILAAFFLVVYFCFVIVWSDIEV